MTAVWPASLTQFFQESGFGETLGKGSIESPTDSGQPKKRRRFTSAWRTFQGTVWLGSEAECELFNEFYEETLAFGTLPFTWVNPRTQTASTFRFRGDDPPRLSAFGSANWAATFQLWETARTKLSGSPLDLFYVRDTGLAFMMGMH